MVDDGGIEKVLPPFSSIGKDVISALRFRKTTLKKKSEAESSLRHLA